MVLGAQVPCHDTPLCLRACLRLHTAPYVFLCKDTVLVRAAQKLAAEHQRYQAVVLLRNLVGTQFFLVVDLALFIGVKLLHCALCSMRLLCCLPASL